MEVLFFMCYAIVGILFDRAYKDTDLLILYSLKVTVILIAWIAMGKHHFR